MSRNTFLEYVIETMLDFAYNIFLSSFLIFSNFGIFQEEIISVTDSVTFICLYFKSLKITVKSKLPNCSMFILSTALSIVIRLNNQLFIYSTSSSVGCHSSYFLSAFCPMARVFSAAKRALALPFLRFRNFLVLFFSEKCYRGWLSMEFALQERICLLKT